jgi:hypothetical protein
MSHKLAAANSMKKSGSAGITKTSKVGLITTPQVIAEQCTQSVVSDDDDISEEECSQQLKPVKTGDTTLKITSIAKKSRTRVNMPKFLLKQSLEEHFRAPTRDNSSVIGIQSRNSSAASVRIDLLVAAKTYVEQVMELVNEVDTATKDQSIILSHYGAQLKCHVVLTDLTNAHKQTFVEPAKLQELISSLESYIQETHQVQETQDAQADESDSD